MVWRSNRRAVQVGCGSLVRAQCVSENGAVPLVPAAHHASYLQGMEDPILLAWQ